jgi:hypothetical protein
MRPEPIRCVEQFPSNDRNNLERAAKKRKWAKRAADTDRESPSPPNLGSWICATQNREPAKGALEEIETIESSVVEENQFVNETGAMSDGIEAG